MNGHVNMQQHGGNLEVLKWLRDPNLPGGPCPWAEYMFICSSAGHLEVLKWLRDPDLPGGPCPWDECTYQAAEESDNKEILEWLKSNDCPGV